MHNEWPWQKKLTQKVYSNPKVVIMAIAIIDFKVAHNKNRRTRIYCKMIKFTSLKWLREGERVNELDSICQIRIGADQNKKVITKRSESLEGTQPIKQFIHFI